MIQCNVCKEPCGYLIRDDGSMVSTCHLKKVEIHQPKDYEEEEEIEDYNEDMDGDHASALASIGWGTDEDYQHEDLDYCDGC